MVVVNHYQRKNVIEDEVNSQPRAVKPDIRKGTVKVQRLDGYRHEGISDSQ